MDFILFFLAITRHNFWSLFLSDLLANSHQLHLLFDVFHSPCDVTCAQIRPNPSSRFPTQEARQKVSSSTTKPLIRNDKNKTPARIWVSMAVIFSNLIWTNSWQFFFDLPKFSLLSLKVWKWEGPIRFQQDVLYTRSVVQFRILPYSVWPNPATSICCDLQFGFIILLGRHVTRYYSLLYTPSIPDLKKERKWMDSCMTYPVIQPEYNLDLV